MPHESDVQLTSHDRHDTMLVAALAAGDLAASDRDQALLLTRSCTDCASLHVDLIAIARATTAVPPPIAARPRDFQLTAADAARLRRGGWRRLVAAFSAPRLAVARPLGVGLTTLGLVGLLLGNVSFGLGSPSPRPATAEDTSTGDGSVRGAASEVAPLSASSPAAAMRPQASLQADMAGGTDGAPGSESQPGVAAGPPEAAASAIIKTTEAGDLAGEPAVLDSTVVDPFRPANLLFIVAVVVGLGLLVAGRNRSRRAT